MKFNFCTFSCSGSRNGAYYLATKEEGVAYTYCHMEDIPDCGGGGWTLVMKIDGAKVPYVQWLNLSGSFLVIFREISFTIKTMKTCKLCLINGANKSKFPHYIFKYFELFK